MLRDAAWCCVVLRGAAVCIIPLAQRTHCDLGFAKFTISKILINFSLFFTWELQEEWGQQEIQHMMGEYDQSISFVYKIKLIIKNGGERGEVEGVEGVEGEQGRGERAGREGREGRERVEKRGEVRGEGRKGRGEKGGRIRIQCSQQ